ncbi:MAG TPA: serine hydrolase, partial [Cyclobacteriaceae bacterium]|nr:serine hydrolase [Cyclobacteriaceae bacterium]
MKKILLSTAILAVVLATASAQTKEPDYSDAYNVINQWLEAQVAYQHLPGVSAAVVKDQEVIWSKGFGMANTDQKVKTQTSTIYSICSISKLFTSVAIMQLYDQGKLRLDDPVESVLPNFNIKQQFKDSGPITVRSLLTHSSGLPRESDFPYWTGPDFPFPTQQ